MIVATVHAEVRGDPKDIRLLGAVSVYNVGGTSEVGEYVAEDREGRRAVFQARRGLSAFHVLAQGMLALGLAEMQP